MGTREVGGELQRYRCTVPHIRMLMLCYSSLDPAIPWTLLPSCCSPRDTRTELDMKLDSLDTGSSSSQLHRSNCSSRTCAFLQDSLIAQLLLQLRLAYDRPSGFVEDATATAAAFAAHIHSPHIYLVKALLATLVTGLSGSGLLIGIKLVQESKTRRIKQEKRRNQVKTQKSS